MTWKECRQVEERLRFIARLLDGEKIAGLCREFEGPGKNNGQREAKNQEKRQRGINCVGQAQRGRHCVGSVPPKLRPYPSPVY